MADNLEAILLRLGLDASGFTKGARDARKEVGLLEKGVGSLKSEMVSLAAAAAGGVGLAMLAHEALQFAEAVVKVSEQTGLSIESVQYLRLAADLTGTSVESLAGQVNKLQRQLVEAADNDKLAAKIEGIVGPIADLRALRPEEQLQKVAESIAAINDPAERTAAAVTLLGKSGADAIPELLALAQQQDELTAAFERTGGAVSDSTVRAVENLGDALGTTKTAAVALSTELIGQAAPALIAFLETTTQVIGGLRLLDGEGDNAAVNLSNSIDAAHLKLQQMEETVSGQRWNPFASYSEEDISRQRKLVKGLEDQYNALQNLGLAGAERTKLDQAANAASQQMAAEASASLVSSLENDEAIRANFRDIRFQGDTELEDKLIAMRVQKAAEAAAAEQEEQQIQAQFLADLAAQTDDAIASGGQAASDLKIQTWQQETQGIAQLLQTQTEGVARHSKAAFEINKAAGIVNTTISTIQAVVKAWADYGWPVGAIVGAAIAVAGAAQVSAIASAKFGQKTAPSQAAQPVTPTAPAQGGGGGGGGGGGTLRVEGVGGDALLDGKTVRTLAEKLLEHQKNGGTVVFDK